VELYSIGKFAKKIGVSVQTLRNWDSSGKLKPAKVTDGGTRYYSDSQLRKYLNEPVFKVPRVIIGYCRVSSHKQKDDLERQIENVKTYMLAKGYQFSLITDIGSGINYTKPGFKKLLDSITSGEVDKVVILYKDRLLRFGFEIIEFICAKFGTEIEIIDNTEKTEQQELVEDLIQIITVFSCRLQGKRVRKTREIIKALSEGVGEL
jgi:predicted site-specific integrase-resolvase